MHKVQIYILKYEKALKYRKNWGSVVPQLGGLYPLGVCTNITDSLPPIQGMRTKGRLYIS